MRYVPSKIKWDLSKLLELLDTQVWGSVQWVLLEISLIFVTFKDSIFLKAFA